MFDTHCHLNFKAFKKNLEQVVKEAKTSGVQYFLIPGTDIKTSKKGIEIAERFEGVYAAVGIHPHHVYSFKDRSNRSLLFLGSAINNELREIEKLLTQEKVLAVGEVGLDRHIYQETKYEDYQFNEELIDLQKELLIGQIQLAVRHNKSLILHNREAVEDMLKLLEKNWHDKLAGRTVFHCCEQDQRLLEFALRHQIYMGVDRDITCNKEKEEFTKKIPLAMLVLETDAPFLLPEPLKSQKKYPNIPANLVVIAKFISKLLNIPEEEFKRAVFENSKKLFWLSLPKNKR